MSYSYSSIPKTSSGICNKSSNNKYFDCPPIMNDARAFTDYRPSGEVNAEIQISNDLKNNQEYRQFLIKNATQIMKINTNYWTLKNQCSPCDAKIPGNMVDCYYTTDSSRCVSAECNGGIGIVNRVTADSMKSVFPYDPTMRVLPNF